MNSFRHCCRTDAGWFSQVAQHFGKPCPVGHKRTYICGNLFSISDFHLQSFPQCDAGVHAIHAFQKFPQFFMIYLYPLTFEKCQPLRLRQQKFHIFFRKCLSVHTQLWLHRNQRIKSYHGRFLFAQPDFYRTLHCTLSPPVRNPTENPGLFDFFHITQKLICLFPCKTQNMEHLPAFYQFCNQIRHLCRTVQAGQQCQQLISVILIFGQRVFQRHMMHGMILSERSIGCHKNKRIFAIFIFYQMQKDPLRYMQLLVLLCEIQFHTAFIA